MSDCEESAAVNVQSVKVAAAKPVDALRYE